MRDEPAIGKTTGFPRDSHGQRKGRLSPWREVGECGVRERRERVWCVRERWESVVREREVREERL